MRKSRFTEEQIIKVLKEHAAGLSAGDVCRKHGISDATFYKWRSRFGGMEISDARRLKALEDENRKLNAAQAFRLFTCSLVSAWGDFDRIAIASAGRHAFVSFASIDHRIGEPNSAADQQHEGNGEHDVRQSAIALFVLWILGRAHAASFSVKPQRRAVMHELADRFLTRADSFAGC